MKFFPFHIFLFFFYSCAPAWYVNKAGYASYSLSDSLIKDDSAAIEVIAPYKSQLDKTMNEVLNVSDVAMTKDQPEGLLGNFVADLVLKEARERYASLSDKKIHMCILNNGGLRTALPKGEITRGKIFELMPFENELTVVTVSGENAKKLFEYLSASGGAPVAGINMGIDDGKPVRVQIGNESFDTLKTYNIVTSDYLANGGDKYSFFKEPVARYDLGVKVRDAIIEFIIKERKQGRTLSSAFDGRIYHVH